MKIILLFSATLICLTISAQSVVRTISVNGQNRSFRLYVPAIYTGNSAVPLVFNFHGYGSNAYEQEFYGDFRPIADTANFILVHPQGLDIGGGAGWNNFAAYSTTNYDYSFVAEMISQLSAEFNIDSERIYSTGLSNGGFMSYDMACFMSDKIAAIASVAGSMIASHKNACNPNRNVPVLQIHGTADQTVSYSGTGGIVTSTNIDVLYNFWRTKNACTFSDTTAMPNISLTDNTTADYIKSSGNDVNSTSELIKIQNGGHTWPGSFPSSGQNTSQDFSASAYIWEFFKKHKLSSANAGIEEIQKNFALYPNPVNHVLTIESVSNENFTLTDAQGKILRSEKLAIGKNELDFFELRNGVYFVKIGLEVQKLIVEH